MNSENEEFESQEAWLEDELDLPTTVNCQSSTWILSDGIDVGDMVENCKLVARLGIGSSGRAFLAQQPALADRWIVLKVTTNTHEEHLNLARLQHTHIMPLYWASTQPYGGLRVLAMPYLAKTTLSALLKRLASTPIENWSGERVYRELQCDQEGLPVQIPVQEHLTQNLMQSSWVTFVLRMGQTLAEALAFAHRRNLLHLDVKPSNILITPDGQPILLDLDVARQPIPAGTAGIPWFGGTPAFCSPEQSRAMEALSQGKPIPSPVDVRSDVYSIGVVLFLALGGILEENQLPDAKRLPEWNPGVTRELAEIVAHCLAERPADRYPTCSALAADLERQLKDLPLNGVYNRWSDRWRKWRRRRPLALVMGVMFTSFCAAMTFAGLNHQQVTLERRGQAESALLDGQDLMHQGQHEAAVRRLKTGAKIASQINGMESTHEQILQWLQSAQRLQNTKELSETLHLLRIEALEKRTPRRLQIALEAAGRTGWSRRDVMLESTNDAPTQAEIKIRNQLQELLVLWSDLRLRLSPPGQEHEVRAEIRSAIQQAEAQFGRTFAVGLLQDQFRIVRAGPMGPPRESWEFWTIGRRSMESGDVVLAQQYFQRAAELAPLDTACSMHLGVLAQRQQNYAEALQSFSFCLGNEATAELLILRSEAFAATEQLELALRDAQLAIERKSDLAYAYIHRGNLHKLMGMEREAIEDFARARMIGELE